MKRLLLPLLAALALPTAVNANVDQEVHKLCLPAADYLGCVKAMTTKSTDIPSMRMIQGETELTGNNCPNGYAYSGAGYCKEIICTTLATPKDLRGMGWKCDFWLYEPRWGSNVVKAVVDEGCPDEEPIIGTQSSCWTMEMIEKNLTKKKKKKSVKTDASTGSIKINCDSPVWKNKPRCN